jgi:hypothetical protein
MLILPQLNSLYVESFYLTCLLESVVDVCDGSGIMGLE